MEAPMRTDAPRGRMGVRTRLIAVVLTAAALAGGGLLANASTAQDTGSLPLPTDIDLGGLPSFPGLTEGVPNITNLWTFHLTDQPGSWFDSGLNLFGTKSLGVATAGTAKVKFISDPSRTDSNHTVSSLLWPKGAKNMPFDQDKAWKNGERTVDLQTPGLYAFVCKMHPFMLGAVIKDDPTTVGLDFGKRAVYAGGREMATDSDLYWRIIRAFFVVTNTNNWQDFSAKNTARKWDPNYAPAPITAYDSRGHQKLIPNLDVFMQKRFREPATLPPLFKPTTPGVGEVWVNLQYEKTKSKSKPGTVTALDATNFNVTKKFGIPEINLNNPHNMWPDRSGKLIYTTQWFSHKLTVFERATGKHVRTIDVGDAPAHVMTRVDTDQVHVGLNGEDSVVELSPGATKIDRRIKVSKDGEKQAQPHAHGMSADGKIMVTPNSNTDDATQIDVPSGTITRKPATGHLPIAAWVHPDGLKFYSSNFLEGTVSCVSTTDKPACADGNEVAAQTKIDLMENYNPDSGTITGPMGGLPIQTPVSPDGKFVVQANTLTATITIIDTKTNDLVKSLVCEAGCHGGNFGAKKGGGYYLYVSNKFSDTMDVVDLDPDGDGDAKDAKIVGRLLTDAEPGTMIDDAVSAYPGQGGQGVLPLPNVNNGWVQNLPPEETVGLTKEQLNPLGTKATARCGRRVTIKADGGSGPRLRKVTRVTMAGRKLKTTRKAGRTLAVVDLSKRTSGVAVIRITGKTTMGRTVTRVRKISACATRR
jgi:DNA-binding beta-propeller fold protein YncE